MLKNLRIGARLSLGFGLLLVMLVTISFVGYWGTSSISGTALVILEGDANMAQHSARARANTNAMRRYEKDLFMNIGSPDKEADYLKKWTEDKDNLHARLTDMEKYAENQTHKDKIKSMKADLGAYEVGMNKVVGLIRSGEIKTTQDANKA